ncbi:hypothetical protein RI129_011850 [Pyrocoelia pectoralis]|uniref:MADF domain-containing protein n=1 Tax=Pyrocoelia pectoralis TaxID=417401 RepID=A0AAN7V2M6_9COLE
MDAEKFINLIYGHKCLWDQSDSSYHLRDDQPKAWQEISEEMEISEPESKWPYFKLLLFLRSTMSRRDLKSTVPGTREISDEEDSANTIRSSNYTPSPLPDPCSELTDQQTDKKAFKSPLKKKIKRRQPDEIDTRLLEIEEEKLKCFQGSATDLDAQFLMSRLPFLKDIPKHRKLMVRANLQ